MFVARRTVVGFLVALAVAAHVIAPSLAFPTHPGPAVDRAPDCPVTVPNGQAPPGEEPAPVFHGEAGLWVSLPTDGRILVPWDDVWQDGSLEARLPWWQGEVGYLSVAGHRLDAPIGLVVGEVPDGGTTTGRKVATLRFPAEGCWEVVATAGPASLRFVALVAKITPDACPVTTPNGNTPPNENPEATHHGNGQIWTDLPADSTAIFGPDGPGFVGPDGSLVMKSGWWRIDGQLVIDGRRLDAPAPSLRAGIPSGYLSAFQATGLAFPSEGCWEVTGSASDASLTFVTRVVRRNG